MVLIFLLCQCNFWDWPPVIGDIQTPGCSHSITHTQVGIPWSFPEVQMPEWPWEPDSKQSSWRRKTQPWVENFLKNVFLPWASLLFRHFILSMDSSSKGHFNNLMRFTIIFGNSVCLSNVNKMKDWKEKRVLDFKA